MTKFFLTFFLLFITVPAFAQTSAEMLNRLSRMENEIQTLSDALFRGNMKPQIQGIQQQASGTSGMQHSSPQQAAQMEVRLTALDQQLRSITGKLEEQDYKIRQLMAQLEKVKADYNLRLQDLESKEVSGQSQEEPKAAQQIQITNPAPMVASNVTTPQAQTLGKIGDAPSGAMVSYEQAFAMLRQGGYSAAATSFEGFLSQFPDHNLVPNAQYWLSETYYVRGMYDEAAKGFAAGYQKFPESSKKPDNLLKLALSLSSLEKNSEACAALKQLEQEIPNAPTPIKHRAGQEKTRLNCP